MATPSFITTLHYPRRAAWTTASVCLTEDDPGPLRRVGRILTRARPGVPVVINGFSVPDRLAGILLARLCRHTPVVVADATWSRGGRLIDRLATRIGVRLLAGPRTVFCVSSRAELARWPAIWGVPAERLAVVCWHHGIDDPAPDQPAAGDGTAFTGGHALRDYATVLAAAERTGVTLHIAADRADLPADRSIPPNVTVGTLDRAEFHRRLARSSLVIVSLRDDPDRSAGQTTYLDTMALGGLVAVSATLGTAEHVQDHQTGLIFPPGDAAALAELINWSRDPANSSEIERIRRTAITHARRHFSPDAFVSALLAAIELSRGLVPNARS